jgi:hypothetical protein
MPELGPFRFAQNPNPDKSRKILLSSIGERHGTAVVMPGQGAC